MNFYFQSSLNPFIWIHKNWKAYENPKKEAIRGAAKLARRNYLMMISKPLPLKSLLFQAPKYDIYANFREFRLRLISFFPLSLPKALEDGSSSSSGSSSGYGSQNAVKIEEKNAGKKPSFLTFSLHVVFFLFVLSIFCVCSFFVRFYYQHNHPLLQDWQLLHLQTLQFTSSI